MARALLACVSDLLSQFHRQQCSFAPISWREMKRNKNCPCKQFDPCSRILQPMTKQPFPKG